LDSRPKRVQESGRTPLDCAKPRGAVKVVGGRPLGEPSYRVELVSPSRKFFRVGRRSEFQARVNAGKCFKLLVNKNFGVVLERADGEVSVDRPKDTIVDGDPVATAIVAFAGAQPDRRWDGTATELLEALRGHAPESATRARAWPTGAGQLSDRLRRLAPALRARRIIISRGRTGHDRSRILEIRAVG
jgi:hypothetical protein